MIRKVGLSIPQARENFREDRAEAIKAVTGRILWMTLVARQTTGIPRIPDVLRNRIRRARSCHIKAKQNLCFCSIVFLVFIVLIQSHNVYRPEAAEGSAMRVSPLPREYSPGMPLGLVAVSASRSRPYLQAAGGGSGRQTATCLLVSFGLGRTDGLARGVPVVAIRAKDRHPDGPRPAAPGLGSAGRRSLIPQQSLYHGLGPGRGPFGRGAPKLLGHMDFGANGRLGGGN